MSSTNRNPHHAAAATGAPTAREIERLGRIIGAATAVVALVVIIFSVLTSTMFVSAHHTTQWAAPLLGIAVDTAFVMSLYADGALARHGIPDPGMWPRALRVVTGAASIFLNDGLAASTGDRAAVAIHTIAPALLLLLAEAAPAYRRAFAHAAAAAQQNTDRPTGEPNPRRSPNERPADRPTAPIVRPPAADYRPANDPAPIPVQPTGRFGDLGPRAATTGELPATVWVTIGHPLYLDIQRTTGRRPTEAALQQALADRAAELIEAGDLPAAVGRPSVSTAKRIRRAIEDHHGLTRLAAVPA